MFNKPPTSSGPDVTPEIPGQDKTREVKQTAKAAAALAQAKVLQDATPNNQRKRKAGSPSSPLIPPPLIPPPQSSIPTAAMPSPVSTEHPSSVAEDDGSPAHLGDFEELDSLNFVSGTPRPNASWDETTSADESGPEDGGLQITQDSTGNIQGQRLRRAHSILSEQQNAGETLSEEGPDFSDDDTELAPSRANANSLFQFARNWLQPKTASDCATAKIKDKDWPAIRDQILLNKDLGNDYTKTLSKDGRTINVFKDGKECMSIARQIDKTLKVSSKSPTDVDALIKLFVSTGSKTCNISKAESPEVAAKLYAELTKKGIKVEMSKNISDQLEKSTDPFCRQVAQSYLRKNSDPKAKPHAQPAQPTPTSNTPRPPILPPTAPLQAAPDTTSPDLAANPLTPKPSPLAQSPSNIAEEPGPTPRRIKPP